MNNAEASDGSSGIERAGSAQRSRFFGLALHREARALGVYGGSTR